MREMMRRWDWEHAWAGLVFAAVIVLATLGITAILKPHNVDYYYLSGGNDGTKCVWAHWTWHSDEKAFCSTDANEALDFAQKATVILKSK